MRTYKPSSIPQSPGVYIMKTATGTIIYIGKAKNLKNRVSSYFRDNTAQKAVEIVSQLRHIDYVLASSEREALILERQLIARYKPYYNVMWLDDKTYPYLKLSLNEDFPRLILTREKVDIGAEYYGPYPQVNDLKILLRWLQRIFKWRPCRIEFSKDVLPSANKVKSCLYSHTGRCLSPCLNKVSAAEYGKSINELRLFLKGKYGKLKKHLKKEMEKASQNTEYEKAAEVRDRLKAINSMEEKVSITELKQEDLDTSINVTKTLGELKKHLKMAKWPINIEGFDISNISGTDSVGSMVSFLNAFPQKENYRKYIIKSVEGTDDASMIGEVVLRRYKKLAKEKLNIPDLIVIDGGKGQLLKASESLKTLKLSIPIIALAKNNEEIFVPGQTKPIKLPVNSSALHVLQRIRDESHRFALTFHRLRRKRKLGIEKSIKYF